jgi:hypothetical protein
MSGYCYGFESSNKKYCWASGCIPPWPDWPSGRDYNENTNNEVCDEDADCCGGSFCAIAGTSEEFLECTGGCCLTPPFGCDCALDVCCTAEQCNNTVIEATPCGDPLDAGCCWNTNPP